MGGFVFLESGITFCIQKGGQILLEPRVYIKKGAVFECGSRGRISVGRAAVIGNYVWIGCRQHVDIGAQTILAHGSTIFDVYHRHSRGKSLTEQGYTKGETIIGSDVLVGAKATIGGDVKVGRGCLIAAHAVVESDLPEYRVAGGIPAKVLKKRE
jgi:acetyltransferase-like isoleucine patch superfamily enzyme